MPLADLQQEMRDAVVTGNSASLGRLIVGGQNASKRLAIHLHHYDASLTAAVVGRFPATGWLIGQRRLEFAARRFVHDHPPTAPCIAEYGTQFPGFLATWAETSHLTYVPEFADLDWHLGRLAVSIDVVNVERAHLAAIDPGVVPDLSVTLQPGVHYLHASWPVDELIAMYLADVSANSWTLRDEEVWIQVRGARGSLRFARLGAAEFAFRASLSEGRTLGEASVGAVAVDPSFDPGLAIMAIVDERLLTSVRRSPAGDQS